MHIRWRQVTWYSKLLALLLFIGLPFLGFWGGVRYEQALGPREVVVERVPSENTSASSDNVAITAQNGLPGHELPRDITAQTVLSFEPKQEFELQSYPKVKFHVTHVSRVSGAIDIKACGAGQFIYIPDPNGKASGSCVNGQKLNVDNGPGALAIVELEIENNSKAYISSRFLQMFYNPATGDDTESKLASMQPPMDGYGALPASTRTIRISFLVPEGQEQLQLVYGDYGRSTGVPESQETLLGKSIGGWIVNFAQKNLTDIPG